MPENCFPWRFLKTLLLQQIAVKHTYQIMFCTYFPEPTLLIAAH